MTKQYTPTLHFNSDGSIVCVVSCSMWVETHTCVLSIMSWVDYICDLEHWSNVTFCETKCSVINISKYLGLKIYPTITQWKWCWWSSKVPRDGRDGVARGNTGNVDWVSFLYRDSAIQVCGCWYTCMREQNKLDMNVQIPYCRGQGGKRQRNAQL